MSRYVLLKKEVGQTPLQVIETYKLTHPELAKLPMAYAGRLDPMASGKLLILVGDECKVQEKYHSLDKAYRFQVLFGTTSDTQDILGLLKWNNYHNKGEINKVKISEVTHKLVGEITLSYPQFSSKTVAGKPLHTWALEKRLNEIEIPLAHTRIYKLICEKVVTIRAENIYEEALLKINSIPEATAASKVLGRDFRREEIRLSWKVWLEHHKGKILSIADFYCIASSGTYMRSLAQEIGRRLNIDAFAYSIERTEIGKYQALPFGLGFWKKRF